MEDFLATQMDYSKINNSSGESLILDQIELSDAEAKALITPFLKSNINNNLPFNLFGDDSEPSWTFTVMSSLKPKSTEIKRGEIKMDFKNSTTFKSQL